MLAGGRTGTFLTAWVLIPSLLGISARRILSEAPRRKAERVVKPLSACALLVLCYANASACLPQVLGHPDWDFLALVVLAVVGMCVLTFGSAYALGLVLRADRNQSTALLFGIGMNNNGTGLVLASVILNSRPLVLLPIIAYNLSQHLVAGCVDGLQRKLEVPRIAET
jgi:BASS family bile acid:Na+ symporter